MATKSKPTKEGQPRWTYAVMAIVPLGGLVWAILSYFLPPKPVLQTPTSAGTAPSVSVSGNGSVGVGSMNGGQITIGATRPADTPASSVDPKAASGP